MADNRYGRTAVRGFAFDQITAQLLLKLLKRFPGLIITQGSWSNAEASGGTHRGAGVVDLYLGGHKWQDVLRYAFEIGFFGWYRPTLPGVWKAHLHLGVRGNKNMAASLKAQQVSWANGRNGLQGNGRDIFSWRPKNFRSAASFGKPTTLKVATLNMPGPDKLTNPAGRIAAMWKLLGGQKLHIIGWNELEPIQRKNVASPFAHDVDARLGKNWKLVKPTTAWNENYISYRGDVLTLVAQYDDSILEGRTGNRHLTRAVFRYKDGFTFAVGQLHLVNDGGDQGQRDRLVQAADALKSMQAVSAKHDDCPFIIQGDANTHALLTALANAGGKRTREYADESNTRNDTTYTPYADSTPSTQASRVIDQQYVFGFYVVLYNVLRLMAGKKFRKPRPSDHDAVVTIIRSN